MCETKYLNKLHHSPKYLPNHFLCKIIQRAFHPYGSGVLMLVIVPIIFVIPR